MSNTTGSNLEYVFDHEAAAARHARRAIGPMLLGSGAAMTDRVTLAVSELVTNVIVHTRGGGTLRAAESATSRSGFVLEVQDHDPLWFEGADLPATRRSARLGLKMLSGLADRWGIDATPHGKTVWAEFDAVAGGVTCPA